MKTKEFYLNLPYEIVVRKLSSSDGGGYFARDVDFPFIVGDRESKFEVVKDAKKAFEFVI